MAGFFCIITSMIKLIVFDWDDVFVKGAKEGYFACYHKALEDVGVSLSPEVERERIMAKWGKSFRAELEELLKDNSELLDAACDAFEKEFWGNVFVDALTIHEGVADLLLRLKKSCTLAVASGNHPKMLKERIIPHFHFPDVFSQIVTSPDIEDQEKTKPHPYMLKLIMKTQNVLPSETVFVGDARSDVQMAQNAGVTPIVVLSGHLNRSEAEELGVQYIIDDVTKIEPILEKL